MIGKSLSHYRIVERLGAGGMGEVYRAEDTSLGRHVAIKVLPDEFAGDAERLARFQREAQVLASPKHPNIATLYGLEESDGKRFIVMELVADINRRGRAAALGKERETTVLSIGRSGMGRGRSNRDKLHGR